MVKKKRIIACACLCCCVLIAIGSALFALGKQNAGNDIRDKYPISKSDDTFDAPALPFARRVAIAPNIAEIKVVKQLPDYSVLVGDEVYGTAKEVVFCQYQVALVSNISNTNIVTDADNTFMITFARNSARSYPVLDDGMEAICSLEAASGPHEGKYLLFDTTFYYLDDQTALAAYEGDDSPARKMCSKEALIQQMKSIRNQ